MIGAYYQCYKRDEALKFVLDNYRKIYPSTTLIMVNDGGNDFTEISKNYNANYFYEIKAETEKNLIFKNPESAVVFIQRLSNYIHLINEDFFILLEDDVFVINDVPLNELKNDINGCNFNEFLSVKVSKHLENFRTDVNKFYFGACGGSILRTDFFKKILSNFKQIKFDVFQYCLLADNSEWASDRILSYLCWKYNGTIGQYDGFCETWYPDLDNRFKLNNIQVLHQYKNLY